MNTVPTSFEGILFENFKMPSPDEVEEIKQTNLSNQAMSILGKLLEYMTRGFPGKRPLIVEISGSVNSDIYSSLISDQRIFDMVNGKLSSSGWNLVQISCSVKNRNLGYKLTEMEKSSSLLADEEVVNSSEKKVDAE